MIGYSLLATVVAYLIGLPIGLSARYSRSIADPLMMRSVDVIRAFPPLLLFLLIVTAAGSSPIVLALGVAITQTPAVARLAHSISRTVSSKVTSKPRWRAAKPRRRWCAARSCRTSCRR